MEIIYTPNTSFKIDESIYTVHTHRTKINIDHNIFDEFKDFMSEKYKEGFTKCYLHSMWTSKEIINHQTKDYTAFIDQLWIRCKFL